MSTIAEATIETDQFALADTLRNRPRTEFETVPVVADGDRRSMPFLWASADDLDDLPRDLESDSTTRSVDVVTRLDEEYLFRIDWCDRVRTALDVVLEGDATILNGYGTSDGWRFRILFPERSQISTSHDACDGEDIDLEFRRIHELSGSVRRSQVGLTDSQYETVVGAYEQGYYDVPRSVTLEELAGDIGVSHQALSERLRRGHRTLVERTVRPEIAVPLQA